MVLFFPCLLGARLDQWSTGLKFAKHRSSAESRTTNSPQRVLGGKRSTLTQTKRSLIEMLFDYPRANASLANTPGPSLPQRVHTDGIPVRSEVRRDGSPTPPPHDACHRSTAHRQRVAASQSAVMVGFGRDRSRCWMVPFPKGSRFRIVLRCWNRRSLRYAKRRFKEWPVLLEVVQPIEDLVPTASA